MKHCNRCGGAMSHRIPEGDALPRHICDDCDTIHYQNPRVIVGCIPEATDGRLLLCRRAIEPRTGFWTMPAGFMENGETVAQAALRETEEEACARVELIGLSSIITVLRANQVHIMYRARLLDHDFAAGAESLEVALFHESDIPWDSIAFASVHTALERYLADRHRGAFEVHEACL